VDVLNKIRLLMNKKGWSEYHLSRVSGVPQSTINSMFRNSNLPTITTLESICKAFDISLSEFFADGENLNSLTTEQRAMFDKWSRLTSEQKELLLKLIEQMD